jgi:hypothetical protein
MLRWIDRLNKEAPKYLDDDAAVIRLSNALLDLSDAIHRARNNQFRQLQLWPRKGDEPSALRAALIELVRHIAALPGGEQRSYRDVAELAMVVLNREHISEDAVRKAFRAVRKAFRARLDR